MSHVGLSGENNVSTCPRVCNHGTDQVDFGLSPKII